MAGSLRLPQLPKPSGKLWVSTGGFRWQGQGVISRSVHTAAIKKPSFVTQIETLHSGSQTISHLRQQTVPNAAGSSSKPNWKHRFEQGLVQFAIPPPHSLVS